MTPTPQAIKDAVRVKARQLKFDAIGFARTDIGGAGGRLSEFLDAGLHGDMGWLAAKRDRRADPRVLWPEARSIVVLGLNYGPAIDPLQPLARRERGTVSVYAQGRDYHDVVKGRLKRPMAAR
jgi:epoxyqueuosine reductase